MENNYLELEERELPKAPRWKDALGVGVVAMGLAIGTGELILWPHIITKYGLEVFWAAFLGITFQYFINQEVARHALATGESFFTSSSRVFKWFAPVWLFSAILLYIWPGWASAIGTILKELFGFGNYVYWAYLSLILVLIFTLSGRVAYIVLEKTLKIIVPLFFSLLFINSFFILSFNDLKNALLGLINFGYIPENIDTSVFLGAIVFSGAGGLLNLCVSLWYRDKQLGMGKYIGRIINPITGKEEAVSFVGYKFNPNKENIIEWKKWMRFVRVDQGVIFWFLGFITLILLSLNAFVVLTPKGLVPDGLNVAIFQANIFSENWGAWGFNSFLVMAFLMLFSVMWAVLDAFTRIVSDIIFVNSHTGPFKKHLSFFQKISISHLYYILFVGIIVLSASLLSLEQPFVLLVASAVLGGITMSIYTPIIIYLNNLRLPKELRPSWFTNLMMIAASVFYIYLSALIIKGYLF